MQFVAEAYGVKRFPVMYDDYVLVGPKSDPAGIKGITDVAMALTAIKDKQATFISRGDRSGTHFAELAFWNKDIGIDIQKDNGAWYKSISQGMASALNMANELLRLRKQDSELQGAVSGRVKHMRERVENALQRTRQLDL